MAATATIATLTDTGDAMINQTLWYRNISKQWGNVNTTEKIIATIPMHTFRSITLIVKNEDTVGTATDTIKVYVSNYLQEQLTVTNVALHSAEITGGIVINGGVEDCLIENMSAANGVDYAKVAGNYLWVYVTSKASKATAADNQFIDIICKS